MNDKTTTTIVNDPAILAAARREYIAVIDVVRLTPAGQQRQFTVEVAGSMSTARSAASRLNRFSNPIFSQAGLPEYEIITIGHGEAFLVIHNSEQDAEAKLKAETAS